MKTPRKNTESERNKTCATLGRVAFSFSICLILFIFPCFSVFVRGRGEERTLSWRKIASFTTYFSLKDMGRCENIALAGSFLNGVTVQAFGEFSFNQTVGARTKERGFKSAKIISNGEFVQGVGGGVCQVSTTLYNALLLSGVEVTEFHPHSLAVSYVAPSRDAMVSSSSDLKFFNPFAYAIRLKCEVNGGSVSVGVYSLCEREGLRYEIRSFTEEEILPEPPIEKIGDREEILRQEKKGVKSWSELEIYKNQTLIAKKLLRKDVYAPVRGIIVKKNEDTTKKMPSNVCLFFEKMV
jgi:hypothetical protein